MEYVIGFVVSVLIYAASLFGAIKILQLRPAFGGALVIAVVTAVLELIPGVGWMLALIAMVILIVRFMEIDLMVGLGMVFLAWVLRTVLVFAIVGVLAGGA